MDVRVGPDGALYYLSRGNSAVYRIQYGGAMLPVADGYVKSGAATTNFGGKPELLVKRAGANSSLNRCSYLRFDLRNVTIAPSAATLTLTISDSSSPVAATTALRLYAVSNSGWSENSLTWNTAPGLNRTNFTSTGRLEGEQSVTLQPGQVSFDLTEYVQEHLGKMVTLQLLNPTTDNTLLAIHSREAGAGAPTLTLTY